jgi:Rps23 Pro-64 3,4-dihydroxylase Tpa1-like proline 4-hydroxylase
VRLYGADNPDALRGIYSDGVVLDEAADMSPRMFNEILRPALSDRKGWAVWIGTPKGQNDFYDLWEMARLDEAYFTLQMKASQTGLVDAVELADAKRQMTPAQYEQEYECSFQAAILGAYYAHEMDAAEDEGRIIPNVYDRTLQVHTAWDLGMSDHTSIWFFQQSGFEIRLIDLYVNCNFGLDHYAKVLQDRGYQYGRHLLPHDVKVHELGSGKSRLETLWDLGIKADVVTKVSDEDGINAVRKILPRSWFDAEKCSYGIKALRGFRREYDDIRKVFKEKYDHGWESHPSKAMQYLAVGLQEPRVANKALKPRSMAWVV